MTTGRINQVALLRPGGRSGASRQRRTEIVPPDEPHQPADRGGRPGPAPSPGSRRRVPRQMSQHGSPAPRRARYRRGDRAPEAPGGARVPVRARPPGGAAARGTVAPDASRRASQRPAVHETQPGAPRGRPGTRPTGGNWEPAMSPPPPSRSCKAVQRATRQVPDRTRY